MAHPQYVWLLALLCSPASPQPSVATLAQWFDQFTWKNLGREVCQCGGTARQCQELRRRGSFQCLPCQGGWLLVKTYGGEVEVQARYNPLPSRGLTWVRVFHGPERQAWRRARRSGRLGVEVSGPAGRGNITFHGEAGGEEGEGLAARLEVEGTVREVVVRLEQDQRRPWVLVEGLQGRGKAVGRSMDLS